MSSLDNFWMPFTANKAFKAAPRMFARASGMYYYTPDNRPVLDGTGGLWCVNAGHCRESITQAITQQAAQLDFAPTFNFGHPVAFEAAQAIAAITPQPLSKIFFGNSGAEAVESAMKIALAYHRAHGQGQRTRFIGRERGYHGVGFGGMSVGGIPANRKTYSGALLPHVDHLPHTLNLEHNAFSKGQPAWGAHLADDLERIIALHDASNIAAVIVEPVAGSTGVIVPPQGYLKRLRELCTKHDILLIFDEVITGFGRLGTPFAAQYFDVVPDMICMAKAINNATVPMGAVAAHERLYDTIVNATAGGIEFFHGYTYSGHPLAAAATVATQKLYAQEQLFERAAAIAPQWESAIHTLRDAPYVKDIRNLGLIAGIELESRAQVVGARAMEAMVTAFEAGVLIRVTGDIIALSPPLIIESQQIDQVVSTIRTVLTKLQ